jgi:hypothetical protein
MSKQKLFIEWMAEEYDCGVPNEGLLWTCKAYLQGLMDGMPESANRSNLHQCMSVITSAEVAFRTLRQHQIPGPK